MAKISMHIQPAQFEFIGFEYEESEGLSESTVKRAISDFKRAKGAVLAPTEEGLSAKEVDGILDSWFRGKGVAPDLYSKCNPEQDKWLQAIKRSLKRIKSHATDDSEDSEIHYKQGRDGFGE